MRPPALLRIRIERITIVAVGWRCGGNEAGLTVASFGERSERSRLKREVRLLWVLPW
jgi:hypothetical protein